MEDFGYRIDPRPTDLGGGWRLRLLKHGEEVGGGVFPLAAYAAETEEEAAKLAHEDALAEATIWRASRPPRYSELQSSVGRNRNHRDLRTELGATDGTQVGGSVGEWEG